MSTRPARSAPGLCTCTAASDSCFASEAYSTMMMYWPTRGTCSHKRSSTCRRARDVGDVRCTGCVSTGNSETGAEQTPGRSFICHHSKKHGASRAVLVVKNPPANAEDARNTGSFRSLGCEDPRSRKWQPTPVFLPGKSHGESSLVGYSPQGSRELDMTA